MGAVFCRTGGWDGCNARRVRVVDTTVLSDDWYVLKKVTFDFLRRDGTWQRLSREIHDRGHGATHPAAQCRTGDVLLTRQFRMPAFVSGHDGMLLEAAAGLLDDATPAHPRGGRDRLSRARRTQGVRGIHGPGSVTEKLHFFVGEYDASLRTGDGGGVAEEGEDLEVVEMRRPRSTRSSAARSSMRRRSCCPVRRAAETPARARHDAAARAGRRPIVAARTGTPRASPRTCTAWRRRRLPCIAAGTCR